MPSSLLLVIFSLLNFQMSPKAEWASYVCNEERIEKIKIHEWKMFRVFNGEMHDEAISDGN